MKRRDVLKGISLFSGAVAPGRPALSAADQAVAGKPTYAVVVGIRITLTTKYLGLPIGADMTAGELHDALAEQGALLQHRGS